MKGLMSVDYGLWSCVAETSVSHLHTLTSESLPATRRVNGLCLYPMLLGGPTVKHSDPRHGRTVAGQRDPTGCNGRLEEKLIVL